MNNEQLREQFEADAKEALHWSTVSFDRDERCLDEYAHRPMQHRWLGWLAGWTARDAEVQALRSEIERYRKELAGVAGSYSQLAITASEFTDTSPDMDAVARAIAVARFGLRDEEGNAE